jgi:peptide/nickel transport system ATP-binding protein
MLPLLSIQELSIDFKTETGINSAISKISFDVQRGEIVAVVGESGSGKSVTALSLLQLLPTPPAQYSGGKILFSTDGQHQIDLLRLPADELRRIRGRQISMIFQEPMTSLNPVFTCGHQIMEAILLHEHCSRKQAREKTIALIEQVRLPSPTSIFDRYPHQLSGGQKQRVMIAMAMSCNPSLLVCDEPTTALDVTVQKTILELISELQQQTKMGVIFITHDLGVVGEIANRSIVVYKGKIVEQGPTVEIFSQPKHPYTKALLACRPLLHKKGEPLPTVENIIGEGPQSEVRSPQAEAESSEKRNQYNKFPIRPSTSDIELPGAEPELQPLITVRNLSLWFPSRKTFFGKPKEFIKAVDDVSFNVYKGETLGLVGESGCGKTTLGRALLKLIEPTSGSIRYNGIDLGNLSQDSFRPLRKNLQIVFQDPYSSLNPRLTIGSAIAEPLKVHGVIRHQQERKERVVNLLGKVKLTPEHFNRYPHEFSGGQRQRIVIARALVLDPSFIICDESVSSLDLSVQAQVLNLLNDLKKEFGFTVIFISHDLSVVQYMSDRIMVMNKGKIEEIGSAEQVYYHPASPYTQKLIRSIPGQNTRIK